MSRRAASSLLLIAALLPVAAVSARTGDRNQRMNVDAGNSDCSVNESGPCILTGDVRIVQGTLNIQATRANILRKAGDIDTVKLTGGPVKMKQQTDDGGWMNATASQIDYDMPNDTIVFTGNAVVQQPGKGSISGGRIVYNTRTGQVQSGGDAGGGRVSMTFEPKKKDAATPDAKTDDAEPAAPDPAQDKK